MRERRKLVFGFFYVVIVRDVVLLRIKFFYYNREIGNYCGKVRFWFLVMVLWFLIGSYEEDKLYFKNFE